MTAMAPNGGEWIEPTTDAERERVAESCEIEARYLRELAFQHRARARRAEGDAARYAERARELRESARRAEGDAARYAERARELREI